MSSSLIRIEDFTRGDDGVIERAHELGVNIAEDELASIKDLDLNTTHELPNGKILKDTDLITPSDKYPNLKVIFDNIAVGQGDLGILLGVNKDTIKRGVFTLLGKD